MLRIAYYIAYIQYRIFVSIRIILYCIPYTCISVLHNIIQIDCVATIKLLQCLLS